MDFLSFLEIRPALMNATFHIQSEGCCAAVLEFWSPFGLTISKNVHHHFKINEEIHCVLENLGEGGSRGAKKEAPFLAPGLQLVDGCFGLQNSRKSEINLSSLLC